MEIARNKDLAREGKYSQLPHLRGEGSTRVNSMLSLHSQSSNLTSVLIATNTVTITHSWSRCRCDQAVGELEEKHLFDIPYHVVRGQRKGEYLQCWETKDERGSLVAGSNLD